MEKHENVIIVVLTYIIGFNTAFIAFGLEVNLYSAKDSLSAANNYQQASLANVASTKVVEREDGLYVVTDKGERILSAEVDESRAGQEGFHNTIVTAQVSPNGELIHYCAQAKAEDNFCFNYVYELKSDSIYRVQTGTGEHVASLTRASGDSWSGSRSLMIEGMVSVNDETPWRLH